ncbi:MAG: hypothetical protein RLZZ112_1161 [Verrucomicrobiota bacterium]
MKFKDTALILAGHGSTKNAQSSRHTRETAKRLRKRGIFKEVRAGFWKESPSFQEVFHRLEASEAIVVPWFLTRGYFVEKVLSEQFSNTPIPTRILDPIGARPEVLQLMKNRAEKLRTRIRMRIRMKEIVDLLSGKHRIRLEETSLLLASHGTPLHKGSRVAADTLAEELGKEGYRISKAMFLEEEPKIADWRKVAAPEGPVMVLPHFLAGGLHGSEDVPGLLGIPHGREGWHEVDGRWVGYGAPIGQPEEMEELILKMVGAE